MKQFLLFLLFVSLSSGLVSFAILQEEPLCEKPDEWPRFPGEADSVYRFLGAHIKYPYDDKMNGRQGLVKVQFVVETSGKLTNLELLKDKKTFGSTEMEQEALRVIGLMPNWIPGTKDGEKVRVQTHLPIKFALRSAKSKKRRNR